MDSKPTRGEVSPAEAIQSFKVLLVEDNPGDAELIGELLPDGGPRRFSIHWVSRLSEARQRLQSDHFDLVLLDLGLPDSEGLDTVRGICDANRHIPIVVMTGTDDEQLGLAAVQEGAQDYLVKGNVPGNLLSRVLCYAIGRQKSKEHLRQSENFLRSSLDALSAHIAILNENGLILKTNKAWRDFADANDVNPRDVADGVDYLSVCDRAQGEQADEAKSFAAGIRSVMEGTTDRFQMEYACHSPERKRWFIGRVTTFPEGGVKQVVVAHESITQRKLAEEALRDSELRLMTILDAQTNMIMLIDLAFTILWPNQAACDAAGLSRHELIGRKCHEIREHRADGCVNCPVSAAIRTGNPHTETFQTDGGKTWRVMGLPVRDSSGRIISAVEVSEDFTERISMEEQFRQAQKMEAIGRLAGGVAHDFNNMLSIITGYGELALLKLNDPEGLQMYLSEILDAGSRSTQLVRQLLAFARRQIIEPRVIDINTVIDNSQKMLRRLVSEDIHLNFIPYRDLWSVRIDPTQIDQVMANLAVNARDAIKATGTVSIQTQNIVLDEHCLMKCRPGEYVMLAFSDTGIGMDKATQENIFDPFFTTKEEGKGTGLGLSTVYGIVQQNGGCISVHSEPGQGTTFKLYFPRFYGDAVVRQVLETRPIAPGSGTILVVEDDAQVLKLVRKILKNLGYTIFTAETPAEAIAFFETHPDRIDLLLTDVIMPKMNGKQLQIHLEKIKPGFKTVFMSGYTADIIEDRGQLVEGVHLIQKPFTQESLTSKIREVMESG